MPKYLLYGHMEPLVHLPQLLVERQLPKMQVELCHSTYFATAIYGLYDHRAATVDLGPGQLEIRSLTCSPCNIKCEKSCKLSSNVCRKSCSMLRWEFAGGDTVKLPRNHLHASVM